MTVNSHRRQPVVVVIIHRNPHFSSPTKGGIQETNRSTCFVLKPDLQANRGTRQSDGKGMNIESDRDSVSENTKFPLADTPVCHLSYCFSVRRGRLTAGRNPFSDRLGISDLLVK